MAEKPTDTQARILRAMAAGAQLERGEHYVRLLMGRRFEKIRRATITAMVRNGWLSEDWELTEKARDWVKQVWI